ncbi:hypothetical protein ACFE04_001766 [Oxalis oulophora]
MEGAQDKTNPSKNQEKVIGQDKRGEVHQNLVISSLAIRSQSVPFQDGPNNIVDLIDIKLPRRELDNTKLPRRENSLGKRKKLEKEKSYQDESNSSPVRQKVTSLEPSEGETPRSFHGGKSSRIQETSDDESDHVPNDIEKSFFWSWLHQMQIDEYEHRYNPEYEREYWVTASWMLARDPAKRMKHEELNSIILPEPPYTWRAISACPYPLGGWGWERLLYEVENAVAYVKQGGSIDIEEFVEDAVLYNCPPLLTDDSEEDEPQDMIENEKEEDEDEDEDEQNEDEDEESNDN